MQSWFNKYKVLIFGFIAAVALPLNDLFSTGETSIKTLVIAGLTAAVTWLARNLRGQWVTIIGLIGGTLISYITSQQSGIPINWGQIITTFILQVLAAVSSPAKSVGYERTATIMEAKQEGETAVPSPAKPKP